MGGRLQEKGRGMIGFSRGTAFATLAATARAFSVLALVATGFGLGFSPLSVSEAGIKGEGQLARHLRMTPVSYRTHYKPGTIIVDTSERFLYFITDNGNALRYGIAVGKEGYQWEGSMRVRKKREWPDWRPPKAMIAREKAKGNVLPKVVEGGPNNPLGARALYLGFSEYRIHGTNRPDSIGKAASSGCIRMYNGHVIDLYDRVRLRARVVVIA
ncbi:MAG: L,D-transpeptidase [Hyphomicrobiales bacterium]|nr:L,D-transpeptidase [Hyphomicrobiales bacterium]